MNLAVELAWVVMSGSVALSALWALHRDRQTSLRRIARLERDLSLALASRDAQDWGRRVAEADEVERLRGSGELDKDGIERVPTPWQEEQAERKDKYKERMAFARR
jgi:hypothetical protein